MKSYDETPWWSQLLWPWFGPPWCAEVEDPDVLHAAVRRQFGQRVSGLAGGNIPGEEYLAKGGTTDRRPLSARKINSRGDGCGEDEPTADGERPMVMDWDHPPWAEVDAEQWERIGDLSGEDDHQ